MSQSAPGESVVSGTPEGRSSTDAKSQSSLLRTASRTLVLAGVVSAPIGLFTAAYPPAVEPTVWGYPFGSSIHVFVALALVVAHLLKVPGFVGLSYWDGAGPVTRWSMRVAALGIVVLAICEGVSASLHGTPLTASAAVNLNNGYGAGSMLLAIPSMVGGTVIIRKKLLAGFGRWSVFLSGAFMVFVVTPALITGRGPIAYLALTVWSLFFIWIGRAMGRTLNS
jgi:Ca2+/H+ antiporter